jgi:hypothetical protein
MQNYRPISVISLFAKLLERLMCNRIISFLYENKIFTEAQNGFRKGKCIETAVQSFIEMIQEALDKRIHTFGIFIDLTKACDVLNHKLLLEKLSSYAIRGTTNSWFRSYLTNRRQFIEINQIDSSSVMVNRYRSSSMEIKQGVPQGSVLSLLFLLYINDLPLNIHGANLVMFTNDINVLIVDSDVGALQNKIDRVIAELETFVSRNDLVIDASKAGVMSFYNRQTSSLVKPQVIFNKMNSDYVTAMKFLGIHIM